MDDLKWLLMAISNAQIGSVDEAESKARCLLDVAARIRSIVDAGDKQAIEG